MNDPILYFCDYLPFDVDLTLYLNELKLPSCKVKFDSRSSLIKIDQRVLEMKIFFTKINSCKMVFPIVAHSTPGDHGISISTISGSFYVNLRFSG
jgi:hypothetical protein